MKNDLTTRPAAWRLRGALPLRAWAGLLLNRRAPAERGQQRYVKLAQAVLSGLLGRGLVWLITLVSVPVAVRYLGAERYGVWMTITPLLGWLALADLGLGNSLTNALAQAYGLEQRALAQRYVATAFWLQAAALLALGGLFVVVWLRLDWVRLFAVQSAQARLETAPAVGVAVLLFLFNFLFALAGKIHLAYQEGTLANGWLAAGQVSGLLALLLAVRMQGGLVGLMLAVYGAPLLVTLIHNIWLFGWYKPWLRPLPGAVDKACVRRLAGSGGMFLLIQTIALLNLQTDHFIIAYFLGAAAVTPYSVAWRLFSLVTVLPLIAFPLLWPAYTEALARRDLVWVRQTLRVSFGAALLLAPLLIAPLVWFGQTIIAVWAGSAAVPSFALLLWMGVWAAALAAMNAVACFLNAAEQLKGQMIYGLLTALVNVALSVVLVWRWGVTGVMAGSVIAYLLCNVLPQLWEARLVLRRLAQTSGRAEARG